MRSTAYPRRRGPLLWLACALALSSGCATAPSRPPEKAACRTVYLFWPGVNHTGILLRKEDFPMPEGVADWPPYARTDWVEVGFGSKEHFESLLRGSRMPKWRVLVRTPGALLVEPFPWGGDPEDSQTSDLRYFRIDLPEADYRKLLAYIKDSFARGPNGGPILADRIGPGDQLYLSSYEYSFRFVCHAWVLKGLREAGVAGPWGWPYLQEQVQEGYSSRYRKPAVCL